MFVLQTHVSMVLLMFMSSETAGDPHVYFCPKLCKDNATHKAHHVRPISVLRCSLLTKFRHQGETLKLR